MEKKPQWATEVQRYGANDPLLKNYQCAAKHNLLPNQVNFKLFLEYDHVKDKQDKLHVNFVQDFFDQFGDILMKQSPEHWKFLMYSLFENLNNNKGNTDDNLASGLYNLVQDQQLVKYLVTFKNDICKCLEQSKFFDKSIDGIISDQTPDKKNKVKEKEKPTRWILNQN